jgi:hypothetical protein
MKLRTQSIGVLLLLLGIALAGCLDSNDLQPWQLLELADVSSVAEAFAEAGGAVPEPPAVEEVSVEVYGRIGNLGAFFCPCFELSSEDETVLVRHGLFAEEGYEDLSVDGLEDGDWIIVAGVLRTSAALPPELWAKSITPIDWDLVASSMVPSHATRSTLP